MKQLGVAVIGYGFIGKVHAYAYRNLPFYYDPAPAPIRLVGVCTSRPEMAEKARYEGGFETGTANPQALIERPEGGLWRRPGSPGPFPQGWRQG